MSFDWDEKKQMKLKQAEKLQIIIKIEFGKCETMEQVRYVCTLALCAWRRRRKMLTSTSELHMDANNSKFVNSQMLCKLERRRCRGRIFVLKPQPTFSIHTGNAYSILQSCEAKLFVIVRAICSIS